MAVLTAGNMKNKISFYRESFVVNTESGEKSKTVSLIKKDVGAEFKYIGTPSAGASEDNIQEQRTGKIKAEIRCRYFRGIKFEDIIYFEGGKFRIYSIQYEGRHEVLKLRAELRDDDTYFGLPDQEYEFLPVQSEFHFRTNADYEVVENVPFPKETNGEYIFESESETYDLLTVFLGIGSAPSTAIKSVRDRFPYSSSGTSMFPDAVGGVVQESPFSYTSPWYLPNPSLSAPYAKVVVGDIVLAEKNDNNAILVGSGNDASPYQDANGEWTYTIDTAGFPNISEPFYHLQFGYNPASLFYRLGTISGGTEYYSRLNARDVENSITKISGYGVITKDYELPMQVFNGCLSFPTDIKARTLRQSGQLSGRMSVSSQEPLLVSSSKEKPKTGNLPLTGDALYRLDVAMINSVTVTDSAGVEVVLEEEEMALIDRFQPHVGNTAGIEFTVSQDEDGNDVLASLDAEWAGGEITFNVNFSPSQPFQGSVHNENLTSALNVDLTYKLV